MTAFKTETEQGLFFAFIRTSRWAVTSAPIPRVSQTGLEAFLAHTEIGTQRA